MNNVLNLVSKIVCFILCVILFLVMCSSLTLNAFTKVVNGSNITKIVSNLDMKLILDDDTITSFYEDADKNSIDRSVIDGLIESKEFKELVGKIWGNAIEYVLYDNEMEQITVDEVVNIMEKQMDIVAAEKGINLSSDDRNIILKQFETEAKKIVDAFSLEEDLNEGLTNEEINSVRFIFGQELQTILLIIVFIIVGLIALLRWSIYRFAIWTGGVTFINGLLFAIISFALNSMITAQLSPALIEILEKNVFSPITELGLIVVGVGALQIIYYIIMKKRETDVIL